MTRGTYTAATGMLANQAALDAVSQNLANASTTGYKQDIPRVESFAQLLLQRTTDTSAGPAVGGLGHGAQLQDVVTDFAEGMMQKTGGTLDVAMTGDAALIIQTPQGIRLTRDGALTRNAQDQLIQASGGGLVLGQNDRPLVVPQSAKQITISPHGEIFADGKSVGSLRLAGLARADNAVKTGNNQFIVKTLRPASPAATVQQGYLEASNVSVVKEMVSMIAVMRAYETDEKMLQSEDDVTGKAINEVSKV